MLLANVVKEVVDNMSVRLTDGTKSYSKLLTQNEELGRKVKELEKESKNSKKEFKTEWTQTEEGVTKINSKEKWIQVKMEPTKKDIGTQISSDEEQEGGQNLRLLKKLEEILKRISKLEKKEERRESTSPTWTQVLGRREKRTMVRDSSQTGKKPPPRKEVETSTGVQQKKKKKSLNELRRKIPKGVGILVDLPEGSSKDYQEVLNKCQKSISLEEMNIPPYQYEKN